MDFIPIEVRAMPVLFFVFIFMGMGILTVETITDFKRTQMIDKIAAVIFDIAGIAFIWFIIKRKRENKPFLGLSYITWFISLGAGLVAGILLTFV